MERISINTLIHNSKKGHVSRPAYIDNLARQMLQMPVEHLVTRDRDSYGKYHLSFDDIDEIMHHLNIPISDSANLKFMDLIFYLAKCMDSPDEKQRKMAFDTVDHFFMLTRSIDKNRAERREK